MAVLKLTDTDLRRLEWNGCGTDIRWDSVLTGLGVRIYPSQKRSFVLGYTDDSGRYKIRSLGSCEDKSLKEARTEAREILRRHDKRTRLQKEFPDSITVKKLGELFIENYARAHRSSWKEDQRRIEKYIAPCLGSTSLPSVRAVQLAGLHARISQQFPIEANRVISLLGRMFNIARTWGYYDKENPAKGIPRNKENRRERWVTPEEMPRLLEAINNEESIFARKAILLYLLTGMRKNELLKATWDDVDFDHCCLHLHKTKNKESFDVELSSAAIKVLRSIPRITANPYIIPGRHGIKGMVDFSKPWNRVRKAAKLEDVWIHDLRRTFASWMLIHDQPVDAVSKALNHKDIRTTMRYAHRLKKDVARAVDKHGEKFSAFINPES